MDFKIINLHNLTKKLFEEKYVLLSGCKNSSEHLQTEYLTREIPVISIYPFPHTTNLQQTTLKTSMQKHGKFL